MSGKIVSVLLVTRDEFLACDFRNHVESFNRFRIDTFVIAENAEELIYYISRNSVDVLILDLKTENNKDVIFLDIINQICKNTIIVGTSDPLSDSKLKSLLENKVNYFFYHPFKKQLIIDRIKFLLQEEKRDKYKIIKEYEKKYNNYKKQKEVSVIKFLYQIGAYPNMKGYEYIKDAICYALDEKNQPHKNNISLYKFLEKIHNQDYDSIGKSMKRFVNSICKMKNINRNITCLEFVSESAERIKIQ